MRPVGVGMLGSGFIGEFHAHGLRYVPDTRLVANCDTSLERREAFAARFGSRPFATIEELCADPEVDLVVVSLPNHLHREAVLAAAAIVNSLKVRIAELLVDRGAMPPVITRSTVVGSERSPALFDAAYREHAQRLARAIIHRHGAGNQQEV